MTTASTCPTTEISLELTVGLSHLHLAGIILVKPLNHVIKRRIVATLNSSAYHDHPTELHAKDVKYCIMQNANLKATV